MDDAEKDEAVEEQAVEEKAVAKNKGGRPKGSPNKNEWAIVVWRYTINQFREDYDVQEDRVFLRPVEEHEKKTYKERVKLNTIKQDNCVSWEMERNEKLARAQKRNRIRVINWYPENEKESDAIDENDGVKFTVMNAGVDDHGK